MNFSHCTLHHCEQRTPEWFDLRRGILTASDFGPYLLKSDKTSEKAKETAICRLVAEAAECWQEPRFESAAMKRGTELEADAVGAFKIATGLRVESVGFCRSTFGRFGCSPDGLIVGENVGFEGKVPLPATHIKYRRAGVLPDEYLFQVHGSMAVTGADAWWFQSYNEKLANFRILVKRDSFTEELKGALIAFSSSLETALAEEERAWIQEFGTK
jgi:hypothetical protein